MCAVRLECNDPPELTKEESRVLQSERGFSTPDRIRHTLKMAYSYKFFDLKQAPNFSGKEWQKCQNVFTKRDELMHPKNPLDLEVTDDLWKDSHEGVTWLMEQFFIDSLLQQKYLS
jgi:hypothetical protein